MANPIAYVIYLIKMEIIQTMQAIIMYFKLSIGYL